ncbi:transcription repressor NadR [Virgibacillus indicus]|uniref:Transcription repressor NadR n=2 Tax=Virgibacillus indicus TaxID=2024554 RepID=A0A265NDP7_9BACI|nr:transcription repressor NadR [Virgibacillus indicus]
MSDQTKMASVSRQKLIITLLKDASSPITGSEFAKKTNVSRQVIVQDISILKAKNEPIVATSQGYIYLNSEKEDNLHQKVVVCNHSPDQTLEELYLIVDHGVTVKDVKVEHAVYGDLTASIRVSNRKEVEQFVKKIKETKASYLASLTGGIHLHTLEADSISKIEAACKDLKKAGIMI